jgi:hypothetical protein
MLATYFVSVDLTLLAQYVYYRRKTPAAPFGRSRSRASAIRRMPSDRFAPRYRTLSVVAANVAAVAALAAQQNEQSDLRRTDSRLRRGSLDYLHRASTSRDTRQMAADEDDALDTVPTDMVESFYSERVPGKRVSWSTERYSRRGGSIGRSPMLSRSTFLPSALQVTPADPAAGPSSALERGRSLQREAEGIVDVAPENLEGTRRSSRGASRRGAGMVFLATWALFGIGTLTGGQLGVQFNKPTRTGRVLSAKGLSIPNPSIAQTVSEIAPIMTPSAEANNSFHFVRFDYQHPDDIPFDDDIPPQQPSAERVLGRIFAWLCTTLYLTSRLPQIWKNVRVLFALRPDY